MLALGKRNLTQVYVIVTLQRTGGFISYSIHAMYFLLGLVRCSQTQEGEVSGSFSQKTSLSP